MDLAYLLRRGIRENAARPAVTTGQGRLSYRELQDQACRLANALAGLGLRRGDRVAVLLENRLEYPVVDVALAYAGLVRVALNVRMAGADFGYILRDCAARALLTQASFDETVAELVTDGEPRWIRLADGEPAQAGAHDYAELLAAASPDLPPTPASAGELAWIAYTSGTTGKPKGVMLSQGALAQVAVNLMVELGVETTSDSVLLVQPLSHGAGYFTLPYLACGGHLHVRHGFDAEEVVGLSRRERVRTLKLVPTMLLDMLDVPENPAFDNIVYGAAPISEAVLGQALDRYGPVLAQLYGQSEAPMTISYLGRADHRPGEPRVRSAGRPWRSVRVDVVDPDGNSLPAGRTGEIVVAGGHTMTGYYRQPELTAEVMRDGWIWTRDMGFRDDEGYLYLRGRRDEMINSGGFNIAPKEVEDVVSRYPGVREVAAVGVPHERWGEAVRVYVAAEPGVTLDEAGLAEFCRPELGFRRPRSIVVVAGLPRTSYGKIDRRRLLEVPS